MCALLAVALRECVQEGVLLLTPQMAHTFEQYATEARQAAAAEVRRAALALAQTQSPTQNASLSPISNSTPVAGEWAWLDALHGCVNRAALMAAARDRAATAGAATGLDLKQAPAMPLPLSLTKGKPPSS